MIRIAICDDDSSFASKLKEILSTYFYKKGISQYSIDIFYSGDALLSDNLSKDIIFLDVEMPGIDGINVGKAISSSDKKCLIIMITSYAEYLDDAMRFNVFRYISKPLDTKRLFRNLDDALLAYKHNQESIVTFYYGNETISCSSSEILFVETLRKKLNIQTRNNQYHIYSAINEFEKQLSSFSFYRCHRSYLVNLEHVVKFSQDEIFLDNGQSIYLAKRKHSDFKKHWLQYLGNVR